MHKKYARIQDKRVFLFIEEKIPPKTAIMTEQIKDSNLSQKFLDLSEDVLKEHLRTRELGKKVFFFSTIDSTNTMAKQLAEKGEQTGTLVIAESQTRGQGRLGRTWHSPPGGLWFSTILRPQFKNFSSHHLTFMAGLSIAQACAKTGVSVSLRWPNDIYAGDKKLGGILTESKTKGNTFEYIVIGIGLNVNIEPTSFPAQLKEEATSLLAIKGSLVHRAQLLNYILLAWEKLLEIYPKQGFAPILKVWKKYATFLGSQVRVDTSHESVEGEAVDVTLTGALQVQDIDGLIHEISCGDVRKLW
jgi:BirA family biotin operon repressor/biotin-[acetyl-CoA-carboxylase] ligase